LSHASLLALLLCTLLGWVLPVASLQAWATHGYALWGDLKYPPGFTISTTSTRRRPRAASCAGEQPAHQHLRQVQPLHPAGSAPAYLSGLMFDTLLTGALTKPAPAYGLLAESWRPRRPACRPPSACAPEARFHNGKPVLAADVKHSFDTLMGKHTSPAVQDLFWPTWPAGRAGRAHGALPLQVRPTANCR
jgi:microcin C transport system substrate-binding protein